MGKEYNLEDNIEKNPERKYTPRKPGRLRKAVIGTATGLALLVGYAGLSGCNHISRDLDKTEQPDKEVIGESYGKLRDIYKSIDISSISDEEREWLDNLNREELSKAIKEELPAKSRKALENICGTDNLSDQDCIFIYRTLKPIYDAEYEFHMQNMMR